MDHRPVVLLFDVDGTLVTTGGAGRRAIERAFEAAHGRRDAVDHFRMDGMTDRAIVRQGLKAIGAEATERAIDHVLSLYIAELEDEVRRTDPARYRLHAGMREALDLALQRPDVALGLGTGNIREGARVKLERVAVYEAFSFGGFGCDHEHRPTLIRIGAERGAQHLGLTLEACRVVVIGDTPKDVEAAQSFGAESLGVGTGSFTPEQLKAAGATYAFADLSAPGALDALLGA
jgi:phosphoglycolate phosphatase-like HAD superfamily hydrolase